MVKGITRQVLVVQSPDKKLFDQAIFILSDQAPTVTEEELLKQAQQLVNADRKKRKLWHYGFFWSAIGAVSTGVMWLLTILLA